MAVPLDVHIEMSQLITDAFRRRDAADRQASPKVHYGHNNAEVSDAAAGRHGRIT